MAGFERASKQVGANGANKTSTKAQQTGTTPPEVIEHGEAA